MQKEKDASGLHVLKTPPPSVLCKKLFDKTENPSEEQMQAVALEAFKDTAKVDEAKRWFSERRALRFAKQEAVLKRRCGEVSSDVRSRQ